MLLHRDEAAPNFVPAYGAEFFEPVDPPPDGDPRSGPRAPLTPALSPRSIDLAADWTEPIRRQQRGTTTWTWTDRDVPWELRVHGTPTLSDDDTALEWVAESEGFLLDVLTEAGETRIEATCIADGRGPGLSGTLRGQAATADALARELADVLPAVAAHTGLVSDHRIETAVMHGGVRAGLREIERLSSCAAALDGYRTLLRESDEPSHADLVAVLRQADGQLTGDGAMRELLVSVLDLSFDDRAVAGPLLAAAATIEDDDLLGEVLRHLLEVSDEVAPTTLARVLRTATAGISRDAPMGAVLEEATWHAMGNAATREAWNAALATVEADAPHALAVESALSCGDTPPEQCLIVLASLVQHVETPSLRAQALAAVHLAELADPRVADAYSAALASLDDADLLTDLLRGLITRAESRPALSARWLLAAGGLPRDDRLAAVLRGVPDGHLVDPSVKARYLPLAASLASDDDRSELLARPPIDPPDPRH
jgi:hypothetical protein